MDHPSSLPDSTPDQRFHRACLPCRESKKKCDKLLPQCSRCQRCLSIALCIPVLIIGRCKLNTSLPRFILDCIYDDPTEVPESTARTKLDEVLLRLDKIEARLSSGQQLRTSSATGELRQETAGSSEPVVLSRGQINHKHLRPSYLRFSTIMNVVQVFVDEGTSVADVARKYMLTTRTWLPLLSQERLETEVQRFKMLEASPGMAVLFLSMYLLNNRGSVHGDSLLESPLYLTCKQLFSLSHSLDEASVELVQAGVLISVFEYMQCIADRAILTLGICAAILSSLEGKTLSSLEDEVIRTWWAVVITCR